MKLRLGLFVVVLCAAAVGCGDGSAGKATVRGAATLTGQSEHSAIVVSLVGPVSRAANAGADGSSRSKDSPPGPTP